jgi:glycosyltransferase involved in cell wall biosynthesis
VLHRFRTTVEKRTSLRCLYIVPNTPISPNYRGGGSAIYYEQLNSLVELGVELVLWQFYYSSRQAELERFIETEPDVWAEVSGRCERVYKTAIDDVPTVKERIYNKTSGFISGREIRNPLVRGKCYTQFKKIVGEVEPDFIWAQHLVSAQISLLQNRIPTVYSHHDWLYKVKNLGPEHKWDLRSKKFEERAALDAAAVVSGSMVECNELTELGCSNVHYIPVAFETAPIEFSPNGEKPRIVHLGGMGTTATRVGLERFFEVVWDRLDVKPADLWVVGDTNAATDEIKKQIANVTRPGYVKDLSSVLRPYDIHVIPWEHETGQRTRLVQAFNHGQALVATRQSVACFPEATHGENCILVESLDEMPAAVNRLLTDRDQRIRLGNAARKTFESSFTRDVLLPRYDRVIRSVTDPVGN